MLRRLLNTPQHLWLRRALFQVHLWAGIGVGLYVFVIGVTGSVLMFRAELAGIDPELAVAADAGGPAVGVPAVVATARAARPSAVLLGVDAPAAPLEPFIAWVEENEVIDPIVVHPITGAILGVRRQQAWLDWLQDLHFYLLGGDTGLTVNGIGGLLLLAMALTGIVIWWPGKSSWRRSLTVDFTRSRRRIYWELHSAVGFWSSALVLMWAATGAYFAFPAQFRAVVNSVSALSVAEPGPSAAPATGTSDGGLDIAAAIATAHGAVPDATLARVSFPRTGESAFQVVMAPGGVRRSNEIGYVSLYFDRYDGTLLEQRKHDVASVGDFVMAWVGAAHTGSFGGWPIKILWAVLGLAPPLLFVTGALVWWNRVVRKKAVR